VGSNCFYGEDIDGAHLSAFARKNDEIQLGGLLSRRPGGSRVSGDGSFVRQFTPNARIPLNRGICGAAAKIGQVVVVDDVQKDARYLSGSTMVKSEIVVPIIVNKLVAELDIESDFPSTFNQSEQQFVVACAAVVGRHLAGSNF
jgi:GAF domain-containing protein